MMPKHFTKTVNKFIVKSLDFNEFLANLLEDAKIEKSSKQLRNVIFQGFVAYDPIRSAGLAKLRRENTSGWF